MKTETEQVAEMFREWTQGKDDLGNAIEEVMGSEIQGIEKHSRAWGPVRDALSLVFCMKNGKRLRLDISVEKEASESPPVMLVQPNGENKMTAKPFAKNALTRELAVGDIFEKMGGSGHEHKIGVMWEAICKKYDIDPAGSFYAAKNIPSSALEEEFLAPARKLLSGLSEEK